MWNRSRFLKQRTRKIEKSDFKNKNSYDFKIYPNREFPLI